MVEQLLKDAKAKNVNIIVPVDTVIAKEMSADVPTETVATDANLPDGFSGFDIGAKTIDSFKNVLLNSKTVIWNGPMGVFEINQFANGTNQIAQILADVTSNGGITIVGGGDSVAAVNKANLGKKMSHISTGGGASLEMLEGKPMPGIACLDDF